MHTVIVRCLILVAIACGSPAVSIADSLNLAWGTNCNGAELMTESSYRAFVNMGQLVVGESTSGMKAASLGVLSAEQSAACIIATPGSAKLKQDGTRLALGNMVVTTGPTSFPDCIYIESPDRSSGIAVVGAHGEIVLLQEGSVINLTGSISTVNGERIILNPMLAVLSQGEPLKPLQMINSSIGGEDFGNIPLGQKGVIGGTGVNNIGLLASTTGLVIDNTNPQYITINDGSWAPLWGNGLRVAKYNLGSLPDIGSYITVVGISSVMPRGSILDAVIKPRKPDDFKLIH